jgi:moderate conductance mechanosensitive channel
MSTATATTTLLAIVVAFAVAALAVRIAHSVVHRLIESMHTVSAENRAAVRDRAGKLLRALQLLAYGIAALASISLALSRFGINEQRWDPRLLAHWAFTHGINIVIVVLGATIVMRASNLAIEHLQHRLRHVHAQSDLEWQRRASTLRGILTSLVSATVWFFAILMVLRELAIDVMPILTGAGIAGLAIGFGAQNLVRDVISGFFIILEDQVRVGDIARINGTGGVVEEINLRTIVLRDGEGAVQVFPNGTITALANMSKQFAYAVVDVRVTYSENVDRVITTIREVGDAMQAEPPLAAVLLAPIEVIGVESLADGFTTVRCRFKTQPLSQGRVANELRRRVVTTFCERGIRPYSTSGRAPS